MAERSEMMIAEDKVIAEDKPTLEFLGRLRTLRKSAGMTQKALAGQIGIHVSDISSYELGKTAPRLRVLIRLASELKYDLSGSVNYQYYHGHLKARTLQKQKTRYGFSDVELGRLTGYHAALVKRSLCLKENGTLPCLYAVIEVLEREKEVRG